MLSNRPRKRKLNPAVRDAAQVSASLIGAADRKRRRGQQTRQDLPPQTDQASGQLYVVERGGFDDETTLAGVKGRTGEAAKHKADLEALKNSDPEFYAYLQQTDHKLLEFDAEDGSDGAEEDTTPSTQHEPKAAASAEVAADSELGQTLSIEEKTRGQQNLKQLTSVKLESLCHNAKLNASMKAMQQLMRGYRTACHIADSEETLPSTLIAASSAVLDKLVLFMLTEAHGIFCSMLGLSVTCTVQDLRACNRWAKYQPLIKSYLGNTLHLVGTLTHTSLLTYALRRIRASVVFLMSSEAILRKLLRLALQVMGSADAAARVQAFLLVREMGTVLPSPTLGTTMKGVYRTFVRNAKFVSAASLPHIHFLGACVIEMFGLDAEVAYEHAFTHIRELAGLLRSALAMKTKDAYREVYCWQTTCTLELWAKIVGGHADKQELRSLAYPVAQLLMGALRLMPTPSFFPLRLRLARSLVGLEAETRVLIPLAAPLLDMLSWKGLTQRVSSVAPGAAGAAASTAPAIRAGRTLLASPAFHQSLVEQVVEALGQHLSHWACTPAFPELAHLPLLRLRRLARSLPVERFRTALRALVAAVEAQAALVRLHRDALSCPPNNLQAAAGLMVEARAQQQAPLLLFTAAQAARAARRRQLLAQNTIGVDAALGGRRSYRRQALEADARPHGNAIEYGSSSGDDAGIHPKARHRKQQRGKVQAAGLSAAAPAAEEQGVALPSSNDFITNYVLSDDEP